jgi:opacity protein-like surface antigen
MAPVMTRILRFASILGAVAVLGVPGRAAADLRLTPFAGVTNVNDQNEGTVGAAVTFGGLISLEFEAARTWLGQIPEVDFVDVDAHLTTYMGNAVLRLPTGPIQPYGSGGVGIVKVSSDIEVPFLGEVIGASASDFAWNLGGGVYIFPVPNIGFRADVRRFQTGDLEWEDLVDLDDIPLPKFNFWRATAGVTIKF